MARPTREEQERRRIANLLAEGKGPNGDIIENAEILSEIKSPIKPPDTTGGYSITELENEISNSAFSGTSNPEPSEPKAFDINSGDATIPNTEDPNYIKPSGHDRFRESIIENESDANKAAVGSAPSPSASSSFGGQSPQTPKDFAEPIINGPSVTPITEEKSKPLIAEANNMTEAEKRKAVEMFADAILQTYSQLYNAAFTSMCKVDMNKMEILDRDGQIRLSMVIERDEAGEMTLRKNFTNYNEEVDEIFTITDEQRAALREPLIAVLLEKGAVPTPMVTLLIVVGSQVLQGVFAATGLRTEMKNTLETMIKVRKEELEAEVNAHRASQYQYNKPQPPQPPPAPTASTQQQQQDKINMDEAISKVRNAVEIKSTKIDNGDNVTIEEVLENG